jgi:hypothetical protein
MLAVDDRIVVEVLHSGKIVRDELEGLVDVQLTPLTGGETTEVATRNVEAGIVGNLEALATDRTTPAHLEHLFGNDVTCFNEEVIDVLLSAGGVVQPTKSFVVK